MEVYKVEYKEFHLRIIYLRKTGPGFIHNYPFYTKNIKISIKKHQKGSRNDVERAVSYIKGITMTSKVYIRHIKGGVPIILIRT